MTYSDQGSNPHPQTPAARSVKGAWLSHVCAVNADLTEAQDDRALSPVDLAVLIAVVASSSDADLDNAYPSVETIRKRANLADRTTRRSLARLRELGWLIVRHAGGRSDSPRKTTVYRIGTGPNLTAANHTPVGTPAATDRGTPAATDRGTPAAGGRQSVPSLSAPEDEVTPSSAATAAAAPKAQKRDPRNSPKTTGKRDASMFEADRENDDGDGDYVFLDWIENEWNPDHLTLTAASEMFYEKSYNWRRVANYVEKSCGYPHRGVLPALPGECIEACSRGMIEAARDRRTGNVRPLRGERHARWEDHCIVPCPACRPRDYADRAGEHRTEPEPTPDEIAAVIARSPLAS